MQSWFPYRTDEEKVNWQIITGRNDRTCDANDSFSVNLFTNIQNYYDTRSLSHLKKYHWDDLGAPFGPYFSYAKEKEIECYLSEDETTVLMTKPTVVTEAKEGTQADLLRMLNEKPSLHKLVNMFELTIIKDKEDEGHTMADACPF